MVARACNSGRLKDSWTWAKRMRYSISVDQRGQSRFPVSCPVSLWIVIVVVDLYSALMWHSRGGGEVVGNNVAGDKKFRDRFINSSRN